jgi:hypothetical protein
MMAGRRLGVVIRCGAGVVSSRRNAGHAEDDDAASM